MINKSRGTSSHIDPTAIVSDLHENQAAALDGHAYGSAPGVKTVFNHFLECARGAMDDFASSNAIYNSRVELLDAGGILRGVHLQVKLSSRFKVQDKEKGGLAA